MITLGKLLVVDDSEVYRELISTSMRPYCDAVLTASSVREAIAQIESDPAIEVVICDVVIGEQNGFDVLEHVHELEGPKPRVVLVTAYQEDAGPERARRLGAAGYLVKPTSIRRILRTLHSAHQGERRMLNPRSRCVGKAYLMESGGEFSLHVAWDVYNLSPAGAFLETRGPLPVGAEFDLLLEIAAGKGRARARVVRVQEPSWLNPGGVGVELVELGPGAEELIRGVLGESNGDSD